MRRLARLGSRSHRGSPSAGPPPRDWEATAWGEQPDIAFMIDQSQNLKGKIEAMIQTVTAAMELYAKAALVNHETLAAHQIRPSTWSRTATTFSRPHSGQRFEASWRSG